MPDCCGYRPLIRMRAIRRTQRVIRNAVLHLDIVLAKLVQRRRHHRRMRLTRHRARTVLIAEYIQHVRQLGRLGGCRYLASRARLPATEAATRTAHKFATIHSGSILLNQLFETLQLDVPTLRSDTEPSSHANTKRPAIGTCVVTVSVSVYRSPSGSGYPLAVRYTLPVGEDIARQQSLFGRRPNTVVAAQVRLALSAARRQSSSTRTSSKSERSPRSPIQAQSIRLPLFASVRPCSIVQRRHLRRVHAHRNLRNDRSKTSSHQPGLSHRKHSRPVPCCTCGCCKAEC